jgi:hypothetical protein
VESPPTPKAKMIEIPPADQPAKTPPEETPVKPPKAM